MNKKLPAALCILLTIPIMVSATTYISIDIQDNKSVNNEKKDYPTPDRNKIIAFPDQQNAEKQSENFRLCEYIRRADNKNTRENVDDSPQKTETNHRIQKIIYYLHQTADNEHGSRKITNGTFRGVGHGKQTNAENKIKQ